MSTQASRRSELLADIANHLRSAGLADMSLRSIARALDLSAPALLYHFQSKENLLTQALDYLQKEDLAHLFDAVGRSGSIAASVQALWQQQSGAPARKVQLAMAEIEGIAANSPERFPAFQQNLVAARIEAFGSALERAGCPEAIRDSAAVLLSAVYRGLLMHRHHTDDSEQSDSAMATLCRLLDSMQRRWQQESGALAG
ncbi:MAG: TetR/AcrR family transcriptional regulator [Pseudomonadaceae bacterium]|nr:TetR/AcrR family transcriptional regulator [Pseudomonadaceae bacterium]